MRYVEWAPVYEAIRADFGYDREADEHARDVLARLTSPFDWDRFDWVEGATVAIVGAGPSLSGELEQARDVDAVFAASTAADALVDAGIDVDCLITDLDKNPSTARQLTTSGTPVAVHAHGDNVTLLRQVVPRCTQENVLATTQVGPAGPVVTVGGFTDGDRAAFLADHLGASQLTFPGWDLDDPTVSTEKRHKLRWAAVLLRWLEHRRGEHFDVLDGRRKEIDLDRLPIE